LRAGAGGDGLALLGCEGLLDLGGLLHEGVEGLERGVGRGSVDGAADAGEAVCGVAEIDLGGALFGLRSGGWNCDEGEAAVGLECEGVLGGLEVEVAEGVEEDGVPLAEGLGEFEGVAGFGEALEAEETDAGVEWGAGVGGAELGGGVEASEGLGGLVEVIELVDAELEAGFEVVGGAGDFFEAEALVEGDLLAAGFEGAFDGAEVVDEERGGGGGEAEGGEAVGDLLVDAVLEEDVGVAAEEADVAGG